MLPTIILLITLMTSVIGAQNELTFEKIPSNVILSVVIYYLGSAKYDVQFLTKISPNLWYSVAHFFAVLGTYPEYFFNWWVA